MIKKTMLALGLATLALSAAGCNTVRGVGADLASAGNEVDEEN